MDTSFEFGRRGPLANAGTVSNRRGAAPGGVRCLWKLVGGAFAVLVLSGTVGSSPLQAQEPRSPTHLSLTAGVFQFEMEDHGVTPMVGVRGASALVDALVLEVGLLAARPEQNVGHRKTFLVPEAQLQLTLPFTRFVPYMGLGAGAAIEVDAQQAGDLVTDLTYSGSVGLKAWLNERIGGLTEFRVRGLGIDFAQGAVEYSVGMVWQP